MRSGDPDFSEPSSRHIIKYINHNWTGGSQGWSAYWQGFIKAPATGEVLAVASMRADGSVPASAFTAVFEPGSTAKIFAAAALLSLERVAAADSVHGEGGR